MRRTLIPVAACVALLFACIATVQAVAALNGQQAPDFVLKSFDGENLRLSEFRGEVVMLNFWATWCGPCRQELPLLDELYAHYNKVGFTLLGVNIDENESQAASMVRELGVSFPVLFDQSKKVSRLYQVDAMPATVLIDRDGRVRHVHRGFQPGLEQQYQKEVRGLLGE